MSNYQPRVAFLTDSYHEVNGVAHTSRHFEAFAKRRDLPFLSVHAGRTRETFTNGSVTTLQLERGNLSFDLDKDLSFDLLYSRHLHTLQEAIRLFRAGVVHITGPSDLGILGAIAAHRLGIPLVASWHTNVHEYAGRRAERLLSWLPGQWRSRAGDVSERASLRLISRFYRLARVLLAPNQELIDQLEYLTGRPCHLMPRGVDTTLFHPRHRDRTDSDFVIGYVGRLTSEKNVRALVEVDRYLRERGHQNFRFRIVGQGADREWLESQLPNAEFTGVLRGDALSAAYAGMDVFAFPSYTDTFGNVVLEALASAVPAVVTIGGGPKFLVRDGESGFVAADDAALAQGIERLLVDPVQRLAMGRAARESAESASWDRVFERVYKAYQLCDSRRRPARRPGSVPLATTP